MRIASFNINGVKARLPRLLEWLQETRPAVACLQEIKSQDEGFPGHEFEAIGYHAIWHGQKGFNGVAILADGVRLLVDSVSLDLVAGCVVDYVESLGGSAFQVTNPQAASGCGCGSSFSV